MQYFTVRSTHAKTTTFSINVEPDKRKKTVNRPIKINGSFPRPNPQLMTAGVSYLNGTEKEALENEPSFMELVEKTKFTVHEIKFKDLPEDLQKSYDLEAYKKLKSDAAKVK